MKKDFADKENRKWKWSMTVSSGHFLVDFYVSMLVGIIPLIVIVWDLTSVQTAMLVTLQSITSNFLQPVFGLGMDKNPKKWHMGIPILLTAIPMCILYYADNYYMFAILVVVSGIGCAMYHPLGAVRNIEGPKPDVPLKMAIYSCMGSFGYSVSPAITGFIIYHFGEKNLIFCLIPAFIWIGLMYLSRPREDREVPQEKTKTKKPDFKSLKNRSFILLNISATFRIWLILSVTIFLAVYIVSQGGDEAEAGFNVTCFLLAGTAGGFFFSWLYKYVSWKLILYITYTMSILFLVVYFYLPSEFKLIDVVLLGFVLFGTQPLTIVLSQRMLPDRAALASGIVVGLTGGIAGFGNLLTGVVVGYLGVPAGLLLTSLIMIPALIVVIFIKDSDVID